MVMRDVSQKEDRCEIQVHSHERSESDKRGIQVHGCERNESGER